MLKITEEQMGIAFEKILDSHNLTKEIPAFDSVFREVPSVQGVPDYIGIRFQSGSIYNRKMPQIQESYLSSASAILSVIKNKSPRTEKYIISKTGLSLSTVRGCLNYLVRIEILSAVDNKKKYILSQTFLLPNIEIWAFELKLHDWKRAVFQALRYKAFANYVIVVFPVERKRILNENIELFNQLNIGVIVFDASTGKYEVIVKAKKSTATSKVYTLYMQGQLLNKYKNKERVKFVKILN